jgi:hypothetical protein
MILQCVCKNTFESDIYDNCPLCGLIPIRIDKPDSRQKREQKKQQKKMYYEEESNFLEYSIN